MDQNISRLLSSSFPLFFSSIIIINVDHQQLARIPFALLISLLLTRCQVMSLRSFRERPFSLISKLG
ncbi:hypothetical protein ACN38_g1598 [Penicillium nordicum]|uniref:Uncharacterized protein n=1 Tax=Penicillium nordicum TaxID=229535 RepID=A0A0M9WJM2_9EURO|nr:hypothetical protein ACN38_g1598 [Penicillium nordicum]